jgi:1-acyl-sn-glycerol-3-phosphate acyltransferase
MSAAEFVRSAAYALVQVAVTPPYSIFALFTFPLPRHMRYRLITPWTRFMMWCAERICGIRYRVLGAENIPTVPSVILANHESAWETMAFQLVFPPQVWVVKRELLWIPFFGWGLAMLSPIAIDRSSGARALKRTLEQGRERLAQGFSIVVFPEGTRSAPGATGTFQVGGAWLAAQSRAPVVPVAHNAGRCWPRKAFIKHAGTITVSIGPVVPSAGRKAPEIMRDVERWINEEKRRIEAHETGSNTGYVSE